MLCTDPNVKLMVRWAEDQIIITEFLTNTVFVKLISDSISMVSMVTLTNMFNSSMSYEKQNLHLLIIHYILNNMYKQKKLAIHKKLPLGNE